MRKLSEKDLKLIEEARKAVKNNYDGELHTVGAALRCKNGRIYTGVNIYSIHGACAEQIALGTAITNGEREFETIVAVRGRDGEEIIPPCGNCRQILHDYMPECRMIIQTQGGPMKTKAGNLLPFAYSTMP